MLGFSWFSGVSRGIYSSFCRSEKDRKKMTSEQYLGRNSFIQPDLPKKEKSFLTFFRILLKCQEHISQLSLKITSEFRKDFYFIY